jgi:hypothetical protein
MSEMQVIYKSDFGYPSIGYRDGAIYGRHPGDDVWCLLAKWDPPAAGAPGPGAGRECWVLFQDGSQLPEDARIFGMKPSHIKGKGWEWVRMVEAPAAAPAMPADLVSIMQQAAIEAKFAHRISFHHLDVFAKAIRKAAGAQEKAGEA